MERRSKNEPRFRAERTPMATPETTHRTAAPTASDSVTGTRSTSWGQISVWVLKEYPKHGALQVTGSGPNW